jgi:pimeloyl-ACP methyl ester carboxylesterase/predicted glycosyltransferase
MRAVHPNEAGALSVAGFQISYGVFGDACSPPVMLLPSWQIAPSRIWKMQIPHLARYFRVIAWDPPGIGGGERTTDPAAFEFDRVIDYGVGLLDHLGIERTAIMGLSLGGAFGLWMAARFPERVERAILIGSVLPKWAHGADGSFWEPRDSYNGWEKRNAHYWREDYEGWLEFFFGEICSEPHSSKMFDDLCSWASETTPEILVSSVINRSRMSELPLEDATGRVQCPVLLIHGTDDRIADIVVSRRIAELRPDFEMIEMEFSGHAPHARDPVKVNQEISRFLGRSERPGKHWRRAPARNVRRALFISSPIGLGHVQRDLAIARELRSRVPDLEIDWLAQPPVTSVLEQAGERIHPMSGLLASEAAHWEESAGEHELHCFQAFREMDEILLANFMVFLDVVRETPYDLWIGDEAWEVDHFLHENPELKTAPYVFITDFIGWLPMDRSRGSREAWLTADYNEQMLSQIERFGRVRDRSLYVGEFDDLVPERFGPGLPLIPEWAREHFTAVGYITPFDPKDHADTRAVHTRLGHDPERPLIIYSVGGTAVGRPLLNRLIDAWPQVHSEIPDARCLVVSGPRIDPETLSRHPGMEVAGYVRNLYEYLAVADLAVVQGGLSTTMELVASRRPFLYFPIRDHCEQVYHVAHRLDRYNAGRRLDFESMTTEDIGQEMVAMCGADTRGYREITPGAAARAANLIAELL